MAESIWLMARKVADLLPRRDERRIPRLLMRRLMVPGCVNLGHTRTYSFGAIVENVCSHAQKALR